jgi:CHAT domain-containing protein/Tfp pilus assembly protein PilF
MPAKSSLIAICIFASGYRPLQSLQPPVPTVSVRPVAVEERRENPRRVTFGSPTRQPVSRQLRKESVHVYSMSLRAGEFVTIVAYQDGVDLKVTAVGPDGKPLLTVNSPNGISGPERLSFVTEAAATYLVEISGTNWEGGAYRIWLAADRPATKKDRADAAAELLFFKSKSKGSSGDKELQEAAILWKQSGNKVRRADALRALGELYANGAEWKRALPVLRRAKALYHGAGEFANEGRIDISIGTTYFGHSLVEEARESYQQAIVQGQRSNDRKIIAWSLYSLGIILRNQGRSVEALETLERERAAWKGLDSSQEIRTLTAMGEIFTDAGNFRQARSEFQGALRIARSQDDSELKAFLWVGMAKLSSKLHEQDQARKFYLEALRVQRKIKSVAGMSISLNGIAATFLNDNRPQEALDPFLQALTIAKSKNDPLAEASVFTNLGGTYLLLNREKDARMAYEQALLLARGRDAQVEAGALLGLTRLEVARRNPIAAQKQAEAAVKCVEGMRAVVGRNLQIPFFATRQDVYDELIEILLWEDRLHPSAGYDAQALRVSEQARSRSLLDSVSSVQSRVGRNAELSIPTILSLPDIQGSVLDSNTLLLEYHLGKSTSYLWVVGNNFHQVYQLPPRRRIEDLARRVAQLLAVSARQEKFHEARLAAEDLSRALLGPAAYWLGQKRLVISAPGVLQSVPFGVLPDPQVSPVPVKYDQWPSPLIVEHEIVRIPSASVAAAIRTRSTGRKRPPNRLGVLSDPVSSIHDERLGGPSAISHQIRSESTINSLYGEFDRLEHAKEEVDAILMEAGPRGVWSATGFDVTREMVLSGRLRSFQNLHFTMHGQWSGEDGRDSALVLSLRDRHGHYRDGFLRASAIYNLDLPASLVVLSACNTGRGESVAGEGVVGLPQAFLAAGATQVIMSLWPIDDLATAQLMKIFYHNYLAKGVSPAAALREAQRAMFRNSVRKAPFYWGGFEIQGDWNPTSARR